MMYNNKLVVSIKSSTGKILREFGETVLLPFGEEYSIYIKNLNTVRAQVKISIDGQDVLNGDSLVVNANSDISLERFLKDKNSGNRFKFIERTSSIENHRGIKAEDGLIRVEYQFEQILGNSLRLGGNSYEPVFQPNWNTPVYYTNSVPNPLNVNYISPTYGATLGSNEVKSYAANDVGITVPGSISNQEFQHTSGFALQSEKYVIILKLSGETKEQKVVQPVTVKTKPECTSCGKINKATSKFCTNCGTSLSII